MVVIEGIPRFVQAAEFLLGNSVVGDGTTRAEFSGAKGLLGVESEARL